jgi:hypothetical protein
MLYLLLLLLDFVFEEPVTRREQFAAAAAAARSALETLFQKRNRPATSTRAWTDIEDFKLVELPGCMPTV